ncbi:MAG TPA: M48 family metallopeptidase [Candidatus Binatia bacterium]|jgi:Zn-dependent protease with chaperone function|nr:M48 family metallopeptidase [Candidatus Binatia bacterium]
MDFFERQDKARRATKWLVLYFIAGVAMLIAAVYLVTALIFTGVDARYHSRHHYGYEEEPPLQTLWNPRLFLGVSIGTLAVIALGSGYKTLELAQGGSAVASMLGGRPVSSSTTDPDERKLLNVVEEMAIASGVPVPQVYLLPDEQAINAFAAGHSTSDAVITVTEGSMRMLTRDELQGVIGHEFSHILNGDMRLNLRLMGAIFGILCLAIIGRVLLQTRSRSSRDRNPLPLLGLALLLIGWVGVFFGRLIQAAVSRQREFLADASSVQFTRNPAGLSGALQKIGRYSYGSRLLSPQAEQASHMFFGNGMGEPFFGLMATHPPIDERIRAIDPAWDGKFPPLSKEQIPVVQAAALAEFERQSHAPSFLESALGAAAMPLSSLGSAPPSDWVEPRRPSFPAPPAVTAQRVLAHTGTPTPTHLRYAEELRNAIPPALQAAAGEGLGSCTLIYGLLLSEDETVQKKQLDELAAATSAEVCQETLRILPQVAGVAAHAKLPLVDLALPGLRHMSPLQFRQFSAAVKVLVESDGEIDLFEYVLQKIVMRHLEPHYLGARRPVIQYYALKPLAGDCAVLLSGLAYIGQQEPEKVASAFEQGAQLLRYAAQADIQLLAEKDWGLDKVDTALNRLSQAVPQIKKNVLDACAQVVAADGVIQETEVELLRAIADTLDCPLPPSIRV